MKYNHHNQGTTLSSLLLALTILICLWVLVWHSYILSMQAYVSKLLYQMNLRQEY